MCTVKRPVLPQLNLTTDMHYIHFLLAVIPATTIEQHSSHESSAVDCRRLLGASSEQLKLFADGEKADLIELKPVHLPTNPPVGSVRPARLHEAGRSQPWWCRAIVTPSEI